MVREAIALFVGCLTAGTAIEPHRGAGAQARVDALALLRQVGGLSAADLGALDRGVAVARVLDTDRRQVAVVGAVRVRAPRTEIVDRYRDIGTLASSQVVLQIGAFSPQPRAADLSSLLFEPYDLESIAQCRPGDCRVRLSTRMTETFRDHVDWRAPDWRERVARLWREGLSEYAAAYRTNGAEALAEYRNKEEPLSVRAEFDVLYRDSEPLTRVAPEFFRHLRDYPRAPLPDTSEILYWSKDDFGLRPVVSLTHLTTYVPSRSPDAFVAAKQIYATHYFDAGISLTLILDDGAGGYYVVSVNRVRTRSLTSFFRRFVRTTVQSRSRDRLERVLESTRDTLER